MLNTNSTSAAQSLNIANVLLSANGRRSQTLTMVTSLLLTILRRVGIQSMSIPPT